MDDTVIRGQVTGHCRTPAGGILIPRIEGRQGDGGRSVGLKGRSLGSEIAPTAVRYSPTVAFPAEAAPLQSWRKEPGPP